MKEALIEIGVDGMTVTEVRGHGRQKGHKEVYRGMEYNVDLLPKVKLEMVIPNARQEEVIRTLMAAAKTGAIGDGKIFVTECRRTRFGSATTIEEKQRSSQKFAITAQPG